ncbi:hypothetical protein PTKIN_Ptkin19aG0073100 [Pterospermum kingtungense]
MFCWRVLKGRVPVKTKLADRNMLRDASLRCSLYDLMDESVDHLFFLVCYVMASVDVLECDMGYLLGSQ